MDGKYIYQGAKRTKVVDKTSGKSAILEAGSKFEVVFGRVNATFTIDGKRYVVVSAIGSKVVNNSKPQRGGAKPKVETLKVDVKPKTHPSAKPDIGIDASQYVWFKYAGARAKGMTDARGNKVMLKAGDIFGIKEGRGKDTILIAATPKSKFSLPTSDSDKLRASAKSYKGKLPFTQSAPTGGTNGVRIHAPGSPAHETVKPTAPKPEKAERKVGIETLKQIVETSGVTLPFKNSNAVKELLMVAYEQGVLKQMKAWLLRQKRVQDAAQVVVNTIEKWKPEGRFLPSEKVEKLRVVLDAPTARVGRTRPVKPPRDIHSPAVMFAPKPKHKTVMVDLGDDLGDDEDWGDGGRLHQMPEIEVDDDIPDELLDSLESDSSDSAVATIELAVNSPISLK